MHCDYTKASPFGRGGGEADGEDNGIQTPTANFISTTKTNDPIRRGGVSPPTTNAYRKQTAGASPRPTTKSNVHLYNRNKQIAVGEGLAPPVTNALSSLYM